MTVKNNDQTEDEALGSTFHVWQNIKAKYSDAIILVRGGEQYYTFDNDAEIVSVMMGMELKEYTTTKYVCNLPHYRTDILLQNIVKAGCSIALYEHL